MFKYILVIFSCFLITQIAGCAPHVSRANHQNSNSFLQADASTQTDADAQNRQNIKNGRLDIEVESITTATQSLKTIISNEKGYIYSSYNRSEREVFFKTKIPPEKLESIITSASSLGEVTSKTISTHDVTDEMINIDAKIKNLTALRDRFRDLLTKTTKISEIIEVERELNRIQTELDSIEGRYNALKSQVAMSTLEIGIKQERTYGPLGYLGKGIFWFFEKLFIIE